MEPIYFAEMLDTLATRSGHATVSWLGFSNLALRRQLLDVFNLGYGKTGNFLADPTFEAVFGWTTAKERLSDLSGKILHPALIAAMDDPEPALASEYRFPASRKPYLHQLRSWELLSAATKKSVVVTSGTGSGKTECFLIPILNRLVEEQVSVGQPLIGVRALFLYPLNALINSQRDRLRAWTHKLNGKIRFCLYNGMTPETLPSSEALDGCEIRDRKTLRKTPPPILVTNATMLEYMLVRTQDAPILQASQGKLEWIILDEAHTYIGSQAAELALLIRRVLHAFGVCPENVRFVATSATIGDPNGSAGAQLRNFLAKVSGCDPEQVFVVSGDREIPKLPVIGSDRPVSLEELRNLNCGEESAPDRYAALVAHPIARNIRKLFTSAPSKPIATLSDVCSVLAGKTDSYSRQAQQVALQWLDILTGTIAEDGTPFLPLRSHLFHQTLAGLWCCSDRDCTFKPGSKLDDKNWPFGMLYLEPRRRCKCGAPVFELVACDDCGAIYLHAQINGNTVVPPDAIPVEDEFALDLEDVETEDEVNETFELSVGPALMMITNRDLPECGLLHVLKQDGTIVENSSGDTVSMTVYEPGPEGVRCPECTKSAGTFREVFRTARVGAPFYLAGILPTLLEFAPDGDRPAEKTYRGRRLLTFTDSRQGTARLAARLQQDAERTKGRGLIYHNLLSLGREDPEVQERIRALEQIVMADPVIATMLTELREKAGQSSVVPFRKLQLGVQQRGVDFAAIRAQYEAYNRELFGGANGPANVAETLLLREVGRRPKRQNNIETMGLVAVTYPGLLKCQAAPHVWTARHRSNAEWTNFLKIALDFVVRNGGSLEIRDELWPWLELPYRRTAIVSSTTTELGNWQRRWPSVKRSGINSLLVRLLSRALRADLQTPDGCDVVDSVLDAAWLAVKTVLKPTANGYVLPLEELAFRPIREAWVCPYTRRLLDTTVCGISPYLPKKVPAEVFECEHVNVPVYDLPFGDAANGETPVRRGREWLAQEPSVLRLREDGLWSTFNDRVIEFAMYYTAAEHSAQQPSTKLQEYEKKFKDGRINILSCSTTMEMGIDIGGVQQVAMNNVPPHPANYLQRAGRAGRRNETRSSALTLCKTNPHDQSVFLNTRWAFDKVLPAPVVSLNSSIIVQRHVNAVVLARFLRNALKDQEADLHKLTCGWFFVDDEPNTPAERLVSWCASYMDGTDSSLHEGLQRLVRHTVFEGFSTARLLMQCGLEIEHVINAWMKEWTAVLAQESLIGQESSDPAHKAITFQKGRLANEYLLRELATQGFLPAHGFPSNVVSFDNLTVSGLRNVSLAELNGTGENNRYYRRELASRDIVTALREYAPGSEIVLDGLVYRSAGITLNWHIPASEVDARETQAIKFAWRCSKCGSSGTSIVLPTGCEVCGGNAVECERFLEPAGFSVDFYEDPHNNVSRQTFVPVERPWVSGRGEWAPLPNPNLGRFRATTEGRVYHHSRGVHSSNYAICLSCGRAEPSLPDGTLPAIFTRPQGHSKLRSKKGDRLCPGSSNRWAIMQAALGHESRTDMLEVQLRASNGEWLRDHATAVTLAVALRDALAELLGVQSDELGCEAREMRNSGGTACQSIFLFDHFAAGYASNAEHLLSRMFHRAAEILDCPKKCDASCPNCVLDFDQRFEARILDRHSALGFLSAQWLKALMLPEELHFFGKSSRIETATLADAVIRETGGKDAGKVRLYIHGTPIDFAASGVRSLAYKLLSLSRSVSLAVTKGSLDKFSEVDRHSLAALAEHPGSSIFLTQSIAKAHDAILIAEVVRENSCVGWACQDVDIIAPTGSWGKTKEPIVIGTTTQTDFGDACVPSSIRPKSVEAGDAELTIQHQLDGSVKTFGDRLWKFVVQLHASSSNVLLNPDAMLVSLTYHDRYLFTPVSIALLRSIVKGVGHVIGPERFGKPILEVHTTAVRQEGAKSIGSKVFSDWPNSQMRNAVTELLMQEFGNAQIRTTDKVQHSRVLELAFSNGELLSLRFDQGVSYWRVSSWSKAGTKATWFHFDNPSPSVQAKAVAEMDVWVEGMAAPTQLFAKVRKGKGAVAKE